MWQSVQTPIIAAVTAATVTVLIELFLKPHLEVRKDKIVEAHKRRRLLISQIGDLRMRTYVEPFLDENLDYAAPKRRSGLEKAQALIRDCREDTRRLQVGSGEITLTLRKHQRKLLSVCVYNMAHILAEIEATIRSADDVALECFESCGLFTEFVGEYHRELSQAYMAVLPISWRKRKARRARKIASSRKEFRSDDS